ncbi:glyceraldehyde 3-phosphate dehydrogenase [Formosa agariphila KMM 3901]|uniref:Glyceraldehyde 3-phosphate dehydrogenase n=1 Tax=Formosa agariphila (strain DSM 15362 / KCTC 12365 / LMG 23005 / KMM 3901 / M-2Alg 35-1) TaxID=1347342 RepID=T2KQV5_FORAG|nr:BamA/TamA family outer membrane protein [Formosa agariphila]CDF80364.1 glyceraldehyde 3-phosphate dehydrogenase [Formosa agariphila KMM 3901]
MKNTTPLFFVLMLSVCFFASAQQKETSKKQKFDKTIFKDSLDGKLDMSDFLIDFNGFIPVVQLITEPALGDIGVSASALFIKPNKQQTEGKYTPPDITLGSVGYTANKTWFLSAIRVASLPEHHLKYVIGATYGDLNMDYFRDLPNLGTQNFGFNFNVSTIFGVLLRQIADTDLYIGPEYFYLHNKIKPQFEANRFPDFEDRTSFTDNISSLGINIDFDKRDNIFTPDTGLYITSDFRISQDWLGSDFNFQNFHVGAFKYFNPSPKWVSGFRYEMSLQFGDAPFFMKPSIALRGVPLAKYQGDQTYVLETEQRYDWSLRWSSVVFGGLAKAPTENKNFKYSTMVYNYGTGFRYLVARKFKLRAGLDFAWSNNDFGWYVVVGTVWNDKN